MTQLVPFLLGIRYHLEDVTRKSVRMFPDGSSVVRSHNQYDYYTLSAFVENTFRLHRLSFTPGVRIEIVDIDEPEPLTAASTASGGNDASSGRSD